MIATNNSVQAFKESLLKKLRERRDECRATAKMLHDARRYELEMDYLSWASAFSEAICLVTSEEMDPEEGRGTDEKADRVRRR
jgi:hypothetical protein